jgi:hypothetical protein
MEIGRCCMVRYLETGDVAREEGVGPGTVRAAVAAGQLRVAAVTVRGTRLFRKEDFDAFRKLRREREKVRARASRLDAPAA